MTKPNADPTYTMGRSEGETERLISRSLLYEGITLRFFREAGIGPGMKVLDIGNDFDAVAGRLVLMYMADPAEAVKGFAQRLRPDDALRSARGRRGYMGRLSVRRAGIHEFHAAL